MLHPYSLCQRTYFSGIKILISFWGKSHKICSTEAVFTSLSLFQLWKMKICLYSIGEHDFETFFTRKKSVLSLKTSVCLWYDYYQYFIECIPHQWKGTYFRKLGDMFSKTSDLVSIEMRQCTHFICQII